MKMYKVWSKSDPRIIFVITCDSMDEAYKIAREHDPDACTAQMCTDEEAHQIQYGC